MFRGECLDGRRGNSAFTRSISKLFRGADLVVTPVVVNTSVELSSIQKLEISLVAKRMAEYIRSEGIKNVILLDRSARPAYMALRTYWEKAYPDERKTYNVFFLNPRGMATDSDGGTPLIEAMRSVATGDHVDFMPPTRTDEEVEQELRKRLPKKLSVAKGEPTLVFDNCIHSGETMDPVLIALEDAGFTDLRVGVVSTVANDSYINPDFVALSNAKGSTCLLFGEEGMVQKHYDNVHSSPTDSEHARKRSVNLRRAIAMAMSKPMDDLSEHMPRVSMFPIIIPILNERRAFLERMPEGTRISRSDSMIASGLSLEHLEVYASEKNAVRISSIYSQLRQLGCESAQDAIDAIRSKKVPVHLLGAIAHSDENGIVIAPIIAAEARRALDIEGSQDPFSPPEIMLW